VSAIPVPRPGSGWAADGRNAARIAATLVGLAGVTSITVRLVAAAPARRWLGMTFPGVEPRTGVMLSILAHNIRMLAAVLIACAVAQVARQAAPDQGIERFATCAAARACDVVIVATAVAHALLIGAGVGAYGGRVVIGLLPHGPVELITFSLALALYCGARREPIAPQRWVIVASTCVLGLTAAALLEVFGPA